MAEENPEQLAGALERETEQLQRHSEELQREAEEAHMDWERKRRDQSVPGAPPPTDEESQELGQADDPGQADA